MDDIDYALIRKLLEALKKDYPQKADLKWRDLCDDDSKYVAHLFYLVEHGLVSASIKIDKRGNYTIGRAALTMRGLDFLQPDGGLTALAAPVVRISHDSIVLSLKAHWNRARISHSLTKA